MRLAILFLLLTLAARAEDTVVLPDLVVEAKRLRGDHRSAVVIDSEELSREAGRPIGEVLREAAGLDFTTGTGGNANLLIRGASGSETLVLIDGVKANDPSITNRYFDWSRIDSSEIERIEILKGPQAVSYGSDAIGGVVVIRTKRGAGQTAFLEAGSEATGRARLTGRAPLADPRHSLGVALFGKGVFDGRSSALGAPGASLEGDDSREGSVGADFRSDWSPGFRTTLASEVRASREDIDAGPFTDQPNWVARNREIRSSARAEGRAGDRDWSALVSSLDFRRAYSQPGDAFAPDNQYVGRNLRAEAQLRSSATDGFEWTLGAEGAREALRIDSVLNPAPLARDHDQSLSLFAEGKVPVYRKDETEASIDLGQRVSRFTSYGTQWSGKAGATAEIRKGLEADAGISTGFKAPSLASLYAPGSGNPDLRPEESVQVEAGVSAGGPGLRLGLRGFASRVRNRFDFEPVFPFRSVNVDRAEVDGVEAEAEVRLSGTLRLRPSLTRLWTQDRKTGFGLRDQPDWKGGAKLEIDASDALSVVVSALAKSSRVASSSGARVSGFSRLDLSARQRISETVAVTARIENALDRDYQEIAGYSAPGLSGYVGLEYRSR